MQTIPSYSSKKHYDLYSLTLSCYKTLFDENANDKVWESATTRFEKPVSIKKTINLFRLVSIVAK